MAEDLKSNLETYKSQLEQVCAVLTLQPDNEEVLKLQSDLLEVIALTEQLLNASKPQATTEETTQLAITDKGADYDDDDDNNVGYMCAESSEGQSQAPEVHWKVGSKCLAQSSKWSKDGQYYEAVIDEITSDGQVSITFVDYKDQSEVSTVSMLKQIGTVPVANKKSNSEKTAKKRTAAELREYLQKRKQKKQQRFKMMDEKREQDKDSWKSFHTKTSKKKGVVRKSIFASPDNVEGRVGIGTCGVSGKKMTEFVMPGSKHRSGL